MLDFMIVHIFVSAACHRLVGFFKDDLYGFARLTIVDQKNFHIILPTLLVQLYRNCHFHIVLAEYWWILYHFFRLIFNKFPLIWANKSWKENECHEWFLERHCPVFHHGILLLGQEAMSVIDFFLDFVPRSTTFIAWLVVKGKYMICSLLNLSLWLLPTWVRKNVAIVCSGSHLRGAFAM